MGSADVYTNMSQQPHFSKVSLFAMLNLGILFMGVGAVLAGVDGGMLGFFAWAGVGVMPIVTFELR